MKKVMFAAAAAASMLAMGAGVESAVVGYHTQATSTAYPTVGCMFVSPGTSSFRLVDIVATGAVYQEDKLQVIDPTTSKIGDVYTWYDEPGEEGWCYFGGDKDEEYVEDTVTFPAGTAFLANFKPTHNVTLTYAGEVLKGNVVIDTKDADGNYLPYPYIINPLPKRVKLQDIIPTGAVYQEDKLQVIDPTTSKIGDVYTWYDEEGEEGWCYFGGDKDEEYVEDSVCLEVGEGYLGNFKTSHKVKLTFPAAY